MFRRKPQEPGADSGPPAGQPDLPDTQAVESQSAETQPESSQIVITASTRGAVKAARPAKVKAPPRATTPRAAKTPKSPKGTQQPAPYRSALVVRGDRVTVMGRESAEGPLTDLKALAVKAKASGPTVAVMAITRVNEKFSGSEDALQGMISTRAVRDSLPYTGLMYLTDNEQVALLETVQSDALAALRAALKGTRLQLAAVSGIPEVAARRARTVITVDRPGNAISGTWAINGESIYITSLKPSETLTQVLITADGLVAGGASGTLVVLTGTFTAQDAESASNLIGGEVLVLTDEQLARTALQPAAAAGLGSLLIRVPVTSSITPAMLLPPLGVALALGAVSAGFWFVTSGVQAQTDALQGQDQALQPVLSQVRALKTQNDQAQHDLDTAKTLEGQKGNLAPDLLALARTVSGVTGAKLSALTGPNPGGSGSAFDGRTVIATYAINAHTTSRQGAESLIAELNMDPYALDTRTVTCKGDAGCTIDATIGLTRRDPQ